jgi:RNA polymerase sigma-70 factor (ECF subfamily)
VTTKRTNEQWLAELRPEHPDYETAVSDLSSLLTKGLRRGLLARVKTSAPEFDTQADDFAQEAMLKVLENIDSFAGRSQFTTWAHKIAISVALTELRRKRWQDSSLNSLTESDGGGDYTPSFVADEAPTPEHRTARAELLTYVQGLIENDLTERQRTALVDSVIQGKSTNQIAKKLNMKPNAVYKLMHDARVKLKKSLAQDGYTPSDILQVFD